MPSATRTIRLTGLLIGLTLESSAQNWPIVRLTKPDAALATGLTSVTAVRELRDRRLLVLDYLDSKVFIVDPHLGVATQVGRVGNGPGEYAVPHKLYRLGGDSTAISDYANTRLLILTPDAKPTGFVSSQLGKACGDRAPKFRSVRATDDHGHYYAEAAPIETRNGRTEATDSAAVERWSAACTVDTVGMIPNPFGRDGSMVVGGFVIGKPRPVVPFGTTTQWVVASDGRVALVRPDPFSVTFIDPTGKRVVGAPIAYQRVRVTSALKDQWRQERRLPVPVITTFRNGGGRISMEKPKYEEPVRWPTYLPPFLADALWFDDDGLLWVERAVGRFDLPTYDVISASGERVRQVRLRQASRVVGFGRGSAYVVRLDDDGFAYLERYRLPAK